MQQVMRFMKPINPIKPIMPIKSIGLMGLLLLLLFPLPVSAQTLKITTIGGNVYGGGNQGDVKGKSTVTMKAATLKGSVYAGARMANVGERAFVNIDGENASGDILVTSVYGGNDISGTIGTSGDPERIDAVPSELTNVLRDGETKETHPKKNKIDNSWNSYVRTTRSTENGAEKYAVVIGSLFGGGNGDYDYVVTSSTDIKTTYDAYLLPRKEGDKAIATFTIDNGKEYKPTLAKTYLELKGGLIAHTYGGGNNATVTENTTIHIENESIDMETLISIYADYMEQEDPGHDAEYYRDYILNTLVNQVKLSTFQSDLTSFNYNMARIYGGNNKAPMYITPTWNLQQGLIRDVYSGGNEGDMRSQTGLLLEIKPEDDDKLEIANVYGGCRRADVRPMKWNETTGEYENVDALNPDGYEFPDKLSARTLVRGGKITNVYGGNDISGRVFGGNAVGIYTSVSGDVYGGGNGGYAYTDNATLGAMDEYKDFYYDPVEVTRKEKLYNPSYSGPEVLPSIDALNIYRPNTEQVSIRIVGTENKKVTVGGSVFVGGNCATLKPNSDTYMAHLKIGSYVITDKVFLGNNGEKMIDENVLKLYAKNVDDKGNILESGGYDYSTLDLTAPETFATYMKGAQMDITPGLITDDEERGDPATYIPYSSYIGSFFCGGNIGSMGYKGTSVMDLKEPIYAFDKVVGGCNQAYVLPKTGLNAAYDGGILGAATSNEEPTGFDGTRLIMNLDKLRMMPMRWKKDANDEYVLDDNGNRQLEWNTAKLVNSYDAVESGTKLTKGETYYTSDTGTGEFVANGTETADEEHTYFVFNEYQEIGTDDPNDDEVRRLLHGNVYGGCYNSGHVNGNVVINVNNDMLDRSMIFPDTKELRSINAQGEEVINTVIDDTKPRKSGVILENQRDDVQTLALTVFGAGMGTHTEIWGSTTVNLNKGYAFQIFGGGEEGIVGKGTGTEETDEEGYPKKTYEYNSAYSTFVNLKGATTAHSNEEEDELLTESEYLYGGGNEGDVCGDTHVNLGNGRIYDAFAGASDANVLGHTEVYIGRQVKNDVKNNLINKYDLSDTYEETDIYPWIRDNVYGGNDFGGYIIGKKDFKDRVSDFAKTKAYKYDSSTGTADVFKANAYVEYIQGRVDTIFGGGYGFYDYDDKMYQDHHMHEGAKRHSKPYLNNTFVNIRPNNNTNNLINYVFGAGTGFPHDREGDKSQDRSYVLIDIPDGVESYKHTQVFGSGSYNGLGMRFDPATTFTSSFEPDSLSAVIDLVQGDILAAYGGSYNEGVTARSVVNVPVGSKIKIQNIFGGAFGTQILPPCDVFESNVNYDSNDATVTGAIYGGNNNERRTLYAKVNITSPVWSDKAKGYTATVYGAGRGLDTWSEYTEVNLLPKPLGVTGDYTGANVYEVYGGGELGHVLNAESVQAYMNLYKSKPSPQISRDNPNWSKAERWNGGVGTGTIKEAYQDAWAADWADAWTLGDYYSPDVKDTQGNVTGYDYTKYATNTKTNLDNTALAYTNSATHSADMGDGLTTHKYNANVFIHEGATVGGYAYGGGLGDADTPLSGDVYGTSYIALLGGTVGKDLYAAGTIGAVYDLFGAKNFTASANAYIKGGTARNVYGGGWKGSVGHHPGELNDPYYDFDHNQPLDILGETNVVIGMDQLPDVPEGKNEKAYHFANGIPAIQRNAYGGGEGGSVWGTTNLTIKNGMIGYRFKNTSTDETPTYEYVPELDDVTAGDNKLEGSGNAFGGGYIVNSYVDYTKVNMHGGTIRGSLYGGGEVGPIGRGTMKTDVAGGIKNGNATIFRAGKTNVKMYNGKVLRNVFGGGRGKDSWGGDGTQYMDPNLVATLDRVCKGYVFGQTEVNIYGGEVGTEKGVEDGLEIGNVFGGSDEGCVYSAYEKDNKLCFGKKDGVRYEDLYEGYYFKYENEDFVTHNVAGAGEPEKLERYFTEDCKVLVEPRNDKKIFIRNAVFAGGNRAAGSTQLNANTNTVFGNATASIHDEYDADLITIGTGHMGGLYGDGNLTLVDGYRELNITNYGSTTEKGRILNTIQRADFCGVFGSKMIMWGAEDRVAENHDNTLYTINRVREVSLNKKINPSNSSESHGNYFGIYNNVNFLGALTSDVKFTDVRSTDNNETIYQPQSVGQTFYEWKQAFHNDNRRNNGNSYNKVALASGVYLELTTEKSWGKKVDEKDWGLITGVVELDLINVATGVGGGYVYAKNEHRVTSASGNKTTTLTALNAGAATQWDWDYKTADVDHEKVEWETSGNFIHSSKTILDDCFDRSGKYAGDDAVKAHYWFIKGTVYIYDQYISAFTGAPNTYSEDADVPLTINANTHGKIKLLDVQPNLYAYYSSYTSETTNTKLTSESTLSITKDNVTYTYGLNDPITYWDWSQLSADQQNLFVPETYIVMEDCKINTTTYTAGTILTGSDYNNLLITDNTSPTGYTYPTVKKMVNGVEQDDVVAFTEVFRSSNNMSHGNGYILTYQVNNPDKWDQWYTDASSTTKKQTQETGYIAAPTYLYTGASSALLGQRKYSFGEVISWDTYTDYEGYDANNDNDYEDEGDKKGLKQSLPSDYSFSEDQAQANFVPAYVVTKECESDNKHYYPGAAVSAPIGGNTAEAFISTKTIKLSETEYIYTGQLMTETEKQDYINGTTDTKLKEDLNSSIVSAYICTVPGLYGGNYYTAGKNYSGKEAWSSMTDTERNNFSFNYDALDLLIDPLYSKNESGTLIHPEGEKYQYDGNYTTEAQVRNATTGNKAGYSVSQTIDFTATYNGSETDHNADNTGKKYMETTAITGGKVYVGDKLTSEQFELLPNEQCHYTPIAVTTAGTYYVVNTAFMVGTTPYAVGETISSETYTSLPSETERGYITTLTFTETDKTYYYCRESYTMGTTVTAITTGITGAGGGITGGIVQRGTLISSSDYTNLPNQQKNFTIQGVSPVETSTLYVARGSDIKDLSQEKIITVIYQYDYDETDNNGANATPVSERHVLNIHVVFKDGKPMIEEIKEPDIVLPGTSIVMPTPRVVSNAFQVIGGGWELYADETEANNHTNGKEYVPSTDPVYWYQDEHYIAYYANTYLGKTYTKPVNIHVANYHDLADVMSDANKAHHMYIDNPTVKRDPKIYINDYTTDDPATSKNGLDELKRLFNLSVTDNEEALPSGLQGHALLNPHVKGGANLEFFMRTDLEYFDDPQSDDWEPIGDETQCFEGTFHGDGHIIRGLDHSLFGYLCGQVYNLGVTGSFTGAGVADHGSGYVENCWINTTETNPDASMYAVFGDPTATETGAKQIENCYYQNTKAYNTTDIGRGLAIPMPDKAFYNGEVAYNLNGFYLHKRFYDGTNLSTGTPYKYLKANVDGTLPDDLSTGYNEADYAIYPLSNFAPMERGYVEERFWDGDFRYSAGTIPTWQNDRYFVNTVTVGDVSTTEDRWAPIWPDDYLFFGQTLTYGYMDGVDGRPLRPHQDVPSVITKISDGRLASRETSNRVYRAPAYFRSNDMGVAHFNPYAVFAQSNAKVKPEYADTVAYRNMTAIDFTGDNDAGFNKGWDASTNKLFYQPLLDDDGLYTFRNIDLTRNLLAYTEETGTTTASGLTATAVSTSLPDPACVETNDTYRTIDILSDAEGIQGHWIQRTKVGEEYKYIAPSDHFLVDKQDFNAPISYEFGSEKRMWYQRRPDTYVGQKIIVDDAAGEPVLDYEDKPTYTYEKDAGWEGVSLPFTAELVTTQTKGEITHFYGNSKVGHEYWLRKFNGGQVSTNNKVYIAKLESPELKSGYNKNYTNTFLWDYYYEGSHGQMDMHGDKYLEYYKTSHPHNDYSCLANGVPYIIGFPGQYYYEFDLSGRFTPTTTGDPNPRFLDPQVITFASEKGATIGVSDDELVGVSEDGYIFKPSYLNEEMEAGTFVLNSDGNAYVELSATAATNETNKVKTSQFAFRPYFKAAAGGGVKEFKGETRSIVFSNGNIGELDPGDDGSRETGSLDIYTKGRKIYTVSHLKENINIQIINAAGATLTTYTLEPGKTIITPVTAPGTYIVNKKKLFIK